MILIEDLNKKLEEINCKVLTFDTLKVKDVDFITLKIELKDDNSIKFITRVNSPFDSAEKVFKSIQSYLIEEDYD